MTDLGEPSGGEDAAAADTELVPGDLLPGLGCPQSVCASSRWARSSTETEPASHSLPRFLKRWHWHLDG
jgi:hypothetical protein